MLGVAAVDAAFFFPEVISRRRNFSGRWLCHLCMASNVHLSFLSLAAAIMRDGPSRKALRFVPTALFFTL